MTPNLLMLGREIRLRTEVVFGSGSPEDNITSYGDYVDKLRGYMQHAHDIARKNLEATAIHQQKWYDGRIHLLKYLQEIMCGC